MTKRLCPQSIKQSCINVRDLVFLSVVRSHVHYAQISKYYSKNNILLHSSVVKGWQLWTQYNTLYANEQGMQILPRNSRRGWRYPLEREKIGSPGQRLRKRKGTEMHILIQICSWTVRKDSSCIQQGKTLWCWFWKRLDISPRYSLPDWLALYIKQQILRVSQAITPLVTLLLAKKDH